MSLSCGLLRRISAIWDGCNEDNAARSWYADASCDETPAGRTVGADVGSVVDISTVGCAPCWMQGTSDTCCCCDKLLSRESGVEEDEADAWFNVEG